PAPPQAGDSSAQEPRLLDDEPWRTDYEAFRANFSVQELGEGQYEVDWGKLQSLEQANALIENIQNIVNSGSAPSPAEIANLTKVLEDVGEFSWETTLIDAELKGEVWNDRLNLSPMPKPLALVFVLDKLLNRTDPNQFKAGDQVRFIGRFIAVANKYEIVAAIRFPDEQFTPAVPADERR
ncbi:MAG TPA: hypothetical protein VII92_09105, partial [Anaerolineae bacterium]